MKCSVYIAASADGYIATPDGGVDWLHTSGSLDADMGSEDMGFKNFMDSVDCMIMGRKCMEAIANMNLTPEQWPYGNLRIIVLSNTIKEAPDSLKGKIEMYSGDLQELVAGLEEEGHKHTYIDGGRTIQTFLDLEFINEMTITQIPVLLGEGISLFGQMNKQVKLEKAEAKVFVNDFVQIKYSVNYQ